MGTVEKYSNENCINFVRQNKCERLSMGAQEQQLPPSQPDAGLLSVALDHGGRSVLKMPRLFGSAKTESPAESSRVFAGTWNMNALDSSQRPGPCLSRSELWISLQLHGFQQFQTRLSEVENAE